MITSLLSRCGLLLIAVAVIAAEDGAPPVVPVPDAEEVQDVAGKADPWTLRLFDKKGKLDKAAYAREALGWGVQVINRRLGPDWDFYHPPVKGAKSAKIDPAEKIPTLYVPPEKRSKTGHNGHEFGYQLGSYDEQGKGTFGSTGGQVLYVPDKAGDPGIDRIETYNWGGNQIILAPAPVWWGGSHPEPAVLRAPWQQLNGGPLLGAVAIGRSRCCWSNDGIMLFTNGFIGTAGNQTSDDSFPCLMLPHGKVPTAVAVTNANEIALVTIWDVQEGKGQVAVFALQALNLKFHSTPYTGFPNSGSYSMLKLLGFIDLPGMVAPTAIACASDNHGGLIDGKTLSSFPLDVAAIRERYAKGGARELVASGGYAVVLSRWENLAIFIDLQPLIDHYRSAYLGSAEDFARTKDVGPAPKQWPPTFAVEPRCAPRVLTTLKILRPTVALAGTRAGNGPWFCHIATVDGHVATYGVDALATATPATAAEVKPLGVVQVGRNPTAMTFLRNADPRVPGSSPYEMNRTFAVCCRGDREIDFVTVAGTTACVYRRLRDTRLIDPVALDPCERAPLISVGDFKGRKVINYRYAPTPADHMRPNKSFGVGPDGMDDVECGGVMEFPGFVYAVDTCNVN